MMTRKDYKAIANAIRVSGTKDEIIQNLIRVLQMDNSRFDEDKFKDACGIPPHPLNNNA